jgi:hypothetical protein
MRMSCYVLVADQEKYKDENAKIQQADKGGGGRALGCHMSKVKITVCGLHNAMRIKGKVKLNSQFC